MEHYSIARAFEDSVKSGVAPEYIFEKPENTFSQQYAYWRFLNHLRVKPSITLDHGVLLRQAVRWSNNSIFIGDCDSDLLKVGKKCGVELTAGNLVTMPYKPHWLKENQWSDTDGLDRPPDPIALNEKELAESWLSRLGEKEGLKYWKSRAQKEACWEALKARPGSVNLIGLPTGSGKSLVFQLLSAYGANGVTVVVVPTTALAIDQWMAAKDLLNKNFPSINPQYYASDLEHKDSICTAIENKTCRLIFTSPEACFTGRLSKALENISKSGHLENFVVDEAHIIGSWGGFFRVHFQLLGVLQKKWWDNSHEQMRTFLFSATFTISCKGLLEKFFSLGTSSDWNDFRSQRLRPEILYNRQLFENADDRDRCVVEALRNLPRPLILYLTQPKDAEKFFKDLQQEYSSIECFTGNTDGKQRKRILDDWRNDKVEIIVATSAFGMGVDKSDVRAIVHACFPENLDRYYQEVGRSGRDGATSISLFVPSKVDHAYAKRNSTKLLSDNEIITTRWDKLLNQSATGKEFQFKVWTGAKREGLIGLRTYDENERWNVRLLLMMKRADLITIDALSSEELVKGTGEWRDYITITCKFTPDGNDFLDGLERLRVTEKREMERSLMELYSYLTRNNKRICTMLLQEYGSETVKVCSGCLLCMEKPVSVKPMRYKLNNDGKPKCELLSLDFDVMTIEGLSRFVRDFIQILIIEKKIRRFYFHASIIDKVRKKLLETIPAQQRNNLYRLDVLPTTSNAPIGGVSSDEHIVMLHLEKPGSFATGFNAAERITHIFNYGVEITDRNGRLYFIDRGIKHFTDAIGWRESINVH